jgi:hypothetical protein
MTKTVTPNGLVGSLSSHQGNMVTHNLHMGISIIVVIQINGIKP